MSRRPSLPHPHCLVLPALGLGSLLLAAPTAAQRAEPATDATADSPETPPDSPEAAANDPEAPPNEAAPGSPEASTDDPASDALAARALRAYRRGALAAARDGFDAAARSAPTHGERSTLRFNAAVCAFELGDFADAERRFIEVAEFDPELRAEAFLSAGFAAASAGELETARRHLDAIPADETDLVTRRAELAALLAATERPAPRPAPTPPPANPPPSPPSEAAPASLLPRDFPRSGWTGAVGLTSGYDSNATQSGAREGVGLSTAETGTASPFFGASAELGYGLPLSKRHVLTPRYRGAGLWLTARDVESLSLVMNRGELLLDAALGERWLLRPRIGGGFATNGATDPQPFTADGSAGLEVTWDHSRAASARLRLQAQWVAGFGDYEYLSGGRWLLALGERCYGQRARLSLEGSLRGVQQGSETVTITTLPVTVERPGTIERQLPLSYLAPAARAGFGLELLERLLLDAAAGAELRRYGAGLRAGAGSPAPASRTDLRLNAGVGMELLVGETQRASLLFRYDALGGVAVAGEAGLGGGVELGGRDFLRHLIELGVELRR